MSSHPVGVSAQESDLSLKLDIRPDKIAVVSIDQPNSKANILSPYLWADLGALLAQLKQRSDFRGLMICSSKPGMFIAGADLNELLNATPDNMAPTRAFIQQGLAVLAELEALPFPTVALVDGFALGGGLEVALACDYRIAGTHRKTTFGLPEVTLGLIPGWGGTQRLPRVLGHTRALQMILSNEQYNGPKAVEEGLTHSLVESEQLIDAGARLLLTNPAWREERERKQRPLISSNNNMGSLYFEAMRAYINGEMAESLTRKASLEALSVIEAGTRLSLNEGIALETAAFLRLAASDEAHQLIRAFFESRKK